MSEPATKPSPPPKPGPPERKSLGFFGWIKFALLGFGISSPDERRENFKKWERYRKLREAEEKYYGGKHLDDHVREEHERLEREAEVRKMGRGGSSEEDEE